MNNQTEVYKLHASSRERLVHFLMASAGAATGFAITLKDSLTLSWPDNLVVIAICAFALSFWAGVRTSKHTHHLIYTNGIYLERLAETPMEYASELKEIAHEYGFDPIQKRAGRWSLVQTYSLVIGAFSLMLWRLAAGYPQLTPALALRWLGIN